ncbi:MAG: polysaccharide biosynthesis tyrosine autokinase [Chryseolinea sp.]
MFQYFPYWPLFLALVIVMLASAWTYLKLTNPKYQITATVLINDEKKGAEDSRIMESFNIYGSKKIVENEIEVIRSKKIMKETVEILGLCSPVMEEGPFVSIPAYTTCPIAVEARDLTKIREVARADFSYDSAKSKIIYNGSEYSLNEWLPTPYGEIRFITNTHYESMGHGPFYFRLINQQKVTEALLATLSVQPSNKLSTVVTLTIEDVVPKRGEDILNTIIESYDRAVTDNNNRLAANTLEFVEDRIRLIELELDSLERNIERYKSRKGIVDLSEQGKLFLKNVGENDQKLSELNMQIAVLDKLEDYVVKKNNTEGIVPSTLGVSDERLSLLIQKLYESEIQYEKLKNTTAENNPILLSLQNEIKSLRPRILESIRNQRSSLTESKKNLSLTNNKYASVLEGIPQQERELLESSRQQSIKNNVYTFLLQKREETALSHASAVSHSRLVDPAEASFYPVSPKKAMIYLGAIAVAFVLGILWVMLKEILSNNILFRSEIEAHTTIPVVAEVSHSEVKDYIVIDHPKKLHLSEQFRHIRTAIGLYGETPKKVIMITSSISGEGKSFISANLATSLAGSKKRVLLIDMDLRNPRLSHYYGANHNPGVSDYLNEAVPIDKIIRHTKLPHLSIIGTGKRRTNSADTLLNGNLQDLFENLREKFDYIIVDAAPINPVSDAQLISQHCDATLYVVRHGKTPKSIVQYLDSDIKIKALKNLGIVFNGVRPRGLVKSGFGYGYGHEYFYSYKQPAVKPARKKVS